jgi:hypothetical protein
VRVGGTRTPQLTAGAEVGITEMRRALLIACLVLAAGAQTAAAAPPWTQPAELATSSDYLSPPAIGVDGEGSTLVAWSVPAGDGGALNLMTGLRAVSPAGTIEPARYLPGGLAAPPVLFGRDGVAVLGQDLSCSGIAPRDCRLDDRIHVALSAALGRTTGAFAPARVLDRYESFGTSIGPAFAGNAKGELAVAYSERRPEGGVVWLAERRPGHGFGKPVAVARGGAVGQVAVAVGARGELLVVYARGGRVLARTRRPGHALGRADDIASAGRRVAFRAAVTGNGLAVVALQRDHVVSQGRGLPLVTTAVRVAIRGPRAARFGGARLLGSLDTGGLSRLPRLATAPDGSALVASVAGVGRVDPAGASLARLTVTHQAADVAVRSDGTAVVVGIELALGSAPRVVASYAPPGGAFGAGEVVAAEPGAAAPVAAFGPRTGRPVAAWLADGTAPARVALHSATRGCQDSDCG